MEGLYVSLIIICLFLIFTPQARVQLENVVTKIYSHVAPAKPKERGVGVTNGGMMNMAYGLAEEQARLYNNIPIPPTGQPRGYSLDNVLQ
jgi:hypothetical protein